MVKRRNILIGITAAALVLSSGAIAFAATDTTDSHMGKGRSAIMESLTDTQQEAVQQARADSMKEALTGLVEDGTITQDEADKLSEIRSMPKDNCGIKDLTDEQRTALQAEEKAVFESQIVGLVDDGTLTQAQADQMEQGQKMMASVNLTDEQKEAVMQAKMNAMKEAAANLVEKGTITQDEADAISIMPSKIKANEDGTVELLTEEQKTALNETMKATFESKLAGLVDDGTLTQDLADQILNDEGAMHMGTGGRHGNGFGEKPDSGEQPSETQDTTL